MSEIADQLSILANKLDRTRADLETEEATKTTLIMPFIQNVLGFDVFDGREVIPEFTADVGLKKGEKVDFAIKNADAVVMLIECKKVGEPLSLENASQLFRYFAVTSARIAILTNGNEYRFYTDLDAPNKMDSIPFLELSIDDLDSGLFSELEKLCKQNFDIESVLSAAEELKYVSAAKREFAAESKEMTPEFCAIILSRIYGGRLTAKVREELSPLVAKGFAQFIEDRVNHRLQTALGSSTPISSEAKDSDESSVQEPEKKTEFATNESETEGHRIVRAILSREYAPERIHLRDRKTYCGVIFDDNNRKPICRFYFNNEARLRVGLFDENKNETVEQIDKVTDLYRYSDMFLKVAAVYA